MAQVASHLQKRLVEILRAELGVKETSLLQIRVCQHHELPGIEA
jgi:capsule polysaccharide export protein KpsE/RkpR